MVTELTIPVSTKYEYDNPACIKLVHNEMYLLLNKMKQNVDTPARKEQYQMFTRWLENLIGTVGWIHEKRYGDRLVQTLWKELNSVPYAAAFILQLTTQVQLHQDIMQNTPALLASSYRYNAEIEEVLPSNTLWLEEIFKQHPWVMIVFLINLLPDGLPENYLQVDNHA